MELSFIGFPVFIDFYFLKINKNLNKSGMKFLRESKPNLVSDPKAILSSRTKPAFAEAASRRQVKRSHF
jgi:hypothetical protein